jgi:hypothetical protein
MSRTSITRYQPAKPVTTAEVIDACEAANATCKAIQGDLAELVVKHMRHLMNLAAVPAPPAKPVLRPLALLDVRMWTTPRPDWLILMPFYVSRDEGTVWTWPVSAARDPSWLEQRERALRLQAIEAASRAPHEWDDDEPDDSASFDRDRRQLQAGWLRGHLWANAGHLSGVQARVLVRDGWISDNPVPAVQPGVPRPAA